MEVLSVDWNSIPQELTLGRLKNYVRVYDDEHDDWITSLGQAAIIAAQTYTRQTFLKTQYREVFQTLPFCLLGFPIKSIDLLEARNSGSFTSISIQQVPFCNELTSWSGGVLKCFLDSKTDPPQLKASSISGATGYRLTWTAGFDSDSWPKDLSILIAQCVEENFDNRGSTPSNAQAIRFSRSHELVLEQYVSHHDAIRYA